jgi:E3 ubiquitin-protein ligase NEDD4
VYDQRRFNKKKRSLGVINIRVGSIIDMENGGDSESHVCVCYSSIPLNETEMITRDLEESIDDLFVTGRLIVNLSTELGPNYVLPRFSGAMRDFLSLSTRDR